MAGDEALAPLLIVCGPTAAGKSALALRVAALEPLTIVSADSRQIYRRFDIGTAKPTRAEQRAVPHAGIDLVEPETRYSAFAWAAVAAEAIARARQAGRIPLVVGGAGFYLRALVTPAPGVVRYAARFLVVDPGPALATWIASRVDAMERGGWVDEARALDIDVASGAPAWQASGYTAMRDVARGRLTWPAARAAAIVATRQYAKRQRTWFRHQLPASHVTHLNPAMERDGGLAIAQRWLAAAAAREEKGERREVDQIGPQ